MLTVETGVPDRWELQDGTTFFLAVQGVSWLVAQRRWSESRQGFHTRCPGPGYPGASAASLPGVAPDRGSRD